MSGLTPEITPTQQFPAPQLQMEPQQMHQMAAMMSMAPDASAIAAVAAAQQAASAFPNVDPSQVYAQMVTHYLQQAQAAQAYAGMNDAAMASAAQFAAPAPLPNYSSPPPSIPAISVVVEGMKFQYQLTEDDLLKVFQRYGSVRNICVDQVGTMALITFDDFNCAQAAMHDLNGKVLNGLEGTLRINWAQAGQQPAAAPATPYSMMPSFSGGWGFSGNAAWSVPPASPLVAPSVPEMFASAPSPPPPSSPQPPGTPPPSYHVPTITPDGKAPAHVKGVRKYTCRFLIGIDNDKDFQVVRRIIGAKGSNMKRIVKQTEAKLRLRGLGSGYGEGASGKESNEPLQLCVSCTSADGYRTAVRQSEELLEGVYSEYRAFCQETGRPELDLHALAQPMSTGRERGGAGGMGIDSLFSPDGESPGVLQYGDDDDDDDDLPGTLAKREGGRKRGRRSRGRKADGKVEKGEPPRNAPDVEEIQHLIGERNEARRQCNFVEADRIRHSLHERGVALMDEPGGRGKAAEVTTWRYWRE